ncbi:RNA polymerase II-associated protein 3-like isoform X2 [Palaemon carinicauda]|uniref:RNA polymerase II-associated protein 3-like isoform X2 n=1 Tax=Palaemon carinicauda TaxID=392227 RepID=UPI0035B5B5A3
MPKDIRASIELQKDIKDNSLEVQDFIADIRKWEKEVKEKETLANERESETTSKDWPPVRCKKSDGSTVKLVTDSGKRKEKKEPNKSKKEKISSYDYAAWDKFDVDKALESSSSEDEKEVPPKSPKPQIIEKSSSASYKAPTQNQKERAVKLKDEGNKHYSNNRLEDAVAKYTQGMALDPTNPILPANRAMAYIKLEKFEAAELDCSRCLKLDSNYIKAYLRRGTSRLKLGKIQQSAEDFRKVLELEPWNKDAKKELENIEKEKNEVSNKEKSDQEKKSPQNENKPVSVEASVNTASKKKDKSEASTKPPETKPKSGKKLKITEVDSSSDVPRASLSKGSEEVAPIVKSPHQRSQKPLKKIKVLDIPSEDCLPKDLPIGSVPKEKTAKVVSNTISNNIRVAENSQEQDIVAAKNAQNKLEKPVVVNLSLPPVPRTSYQFSQDWQRLTGHQPLAVEYLKGIQPSFFQDVDLEPEVFVDFVSALRWDEFSPEEVVAYLSALAKSDGFSVNMMFLDTKQKKVFHEVIEKCKCQEKLHAALLSKLEENLL